MIENISDSLLNCSSRMKKRVDLTSLKGGIDPRLKNLPCFSIDEFISSLELAKKQGKTEFVIESTELVFEIICFKSMTEEERIQEQIHEKEIEIQALKDRLNK